MLFLLRSTHFACGILGEGEKATYTCRKYSRGIVVKVRGVKMVWKQAGVQYIVACVDVNQYDAIRRDIGLGPAREGYNMHVTLFTRDINVYKQVS